MSSSGRAAKPEDAERAGPRPATMALVENEDALHDVNVVKNKQKRNEIVRKIKKKRKAAVSVAGDGAGDAHATL